MAKEKTYRLCISNTGKDNDRFDEGTLEELTQHFSYTLEIGNIINPKVKRGPFKNINMLVNNINKAYEEKEAGCFNRTYVDLAE